MGRFSDADWAKAKRLCRLSRAEVQMARTLGLNPRKLPKQNPSPTQRWKLPVGEWVRALHAERFGEPPDPPPRAARAPQLSAARQPPPAPEPEPLPFGDDAEDFGLESWLEEEPTARELEQEDRYRLRHREAFREAASYVASAFAGLGFVQKVVLFGSVAAPPEREVPRQRRYRQAGALLWHEPKDVDLAVWVSGVGELKALQRARGRALNYLFDDLEMGVAHHQVDVFLFEPGTDRYLGRLCHFGVCPKHKPECLVESCGAALFLRQHEGFVFDPRSLEQGRSVVLFDRAAAHGPDDDEIPF